jgi:hypothetical protein
MPRQQPAKPEPEDDELLAEQLRQRGWVVERPEDALEDWEDFSADAISDDEDEYDEEEGDPSSDLTAEDLEMMISLLEIHALPLPEQSVCLSCNGDPEYCTVTASSRGYFALGMALLRASRLGTNQSNDISLDISPLLSEDSEVRLSWFKKDEELGAEQSEEGDESSAAAGEHTQGDPGPSRRVVVGCFIAFVGAVALLAITGLVAVVRWTMGY